MRSTYKVVVAAILVIILLANPTLLAWGNPPPGRWEKVAETKPGAKITVYIKDGTKQSCRYQVIDDQFITCTDRDDNSIQIELATIDKVVLPKAGEYAKKWSLLGASGGAIAGGISTAVISNDWDDYGKLCVIGGGAGLGALGGLIAGASLGAPGETVYISKELAMKEAKQ